LQAQLRFMTLPALPGILPAASTHQFFNAALDPARQAKFEQIIPA
jgi:hypothetical protein